MNALQYYLIFINIVSFLLMGTDKWRSIRHRWRIPEKTLFLTALLGGSLGSLLGMGIFWHKVRNKYFVVGMPAILIAQLVLLSALTR